MIITIRGLVCIPPPPRRPLNVREIQTEKRPQKWQVAKAEEEAAAEEAVEEACRWNGIERNGMEWMDHII